VSADAPVEQVSFINDVLLVERVGVEETSTGRFASLVASTTVPPQSGEHSRQPRRRLSTPARRCGARFQRFQPMVVTTPIDAAEHGMAGRVDNRFFDGLPPTVNDTAGTKQTGIAVETENCTHWNFLWSPESPCESKLLAVLCRSGFRGRGESCQRDQWQRKPPASRLQTLTLLQRLGGFKSWIHLNHPAFNPIRYFLL
jgi:hypothetical protein